jgi:uncharacterized protein with NAD-binding domain and iron-sulfur cluster
MIAGFWQPVLVSALSESLDRIDVGHARKVFVDAFLTSRDGWNVHIPNVPLAVIYDQMQQALERLGVVFRMESRVAEICPSPAEGSPVALRLQSGETLAAWHIALAVPCWHVAELLPAAWRDAPEVRRLQQIETAPITSVHLWYDRPITELPHCVLTGRVSQWLFRRAHSPSPPQSNSEKRHTSPQRKQGGREIRRGSIVEDHAGSGSETASGVSNATTLYQVVISNSRDLLDTASGEVAAIVERELREAFPAARDASLIRSKVITERRAVFSPTPGIESLRPAQRTPWPGVFWCGDWTATGWPSTMESAVRSGLLLADEVTR